MSETHIRAGVRAVCKPFDAEYWRKLDVESAYPTEFVRALTEAGYLAALIPETYGGSGLDLTAACAILEEICASGGHAGACHAQMYVMGALLRHGSEEQKARFLPDIASGALRLQSFAVTEPDSGSDTTALKTRAKARGDEYLITGQKVWISRVEHSDLMLLLARTDPPEPRKTDGLSVFLIELAGARERGLEIRPIPSMVNHHACELFFDQLSVPAANLVGARGEGFKVILDGMNAERILIAAECVGDGRFFIEAACRYAGERQVFGRPIGQNQGVQFPIARCYAQVEAADLMVREAARLFERREACGAQANMAKLLASEASWAAADMCLDVHGGMGFAREYPVERKFRETRLYRNAPITNNLILAHLAEHVLGLPRSF